MTSPSTAKKIKKNDMGIDDSTERPCVDEETQKLVQEIDNIQSEIDSMNYQASKEIIKIEHKYAKLRQPCFEKRNEIINNITNFWITVFLNHPDISAIINDSEEDCLHHLKKLEVVDNDDIVSGYKIIFYFDENPYFENTCLTKEFQHNSMGGETSSQSTEIKWKEGFDLLPNCSQKTGKNLKKRVIEQKSFFAWFIDNNDPSEDEVAEIIKDDLYMFPLQYFLVPDIPSENIIEDETSDGNDDTVEEDVTQKQD